MSANAHRGEVALVLNDITYVLTPSFAVLAALETAFKLNLMKLAERFGEQGASLSDILQFVHIAGGADAKNIAPETLVGKNYLVVQKALAEFLAQALGVTD